jgi:hypothetical protein
MEPVFKFQPISFSWVAIHPQPKGVIQFMGGAFFGTFPTVFYRYFLKQLFDAGYTIVALPFRFSFRHWSIAASLFAEQNVLRTELIELAIRLGYNHHIYLENSNYLWVGHSLGCKYIALLEFLSGDRWKTIVQECTSKKESQGVENVIEEITCGKKISIKGQSSLLIAPDISDTESAIPVRSLARLLDKVGLGVLPTRKQTQCFIACSSLFNLTALISFRDDTVAGNERDKFRSQEIQDNSDVLWLIKQLESGKHPLLHQELPGKHLEPLGVKIGNYIVDLNPLDKFIEPLSCRFLEGVVIKFLGKLKQREEIL